MRVKIHSYRAYAQNAHSPITLNREGCYNYWERASEFEKAALADGRLGDATYQKDIRIRYENRLLEMDAAQAGNI